MNTNVGNDDYCDGGINKSYGLANLSGNERVDCWRCLMVLNELPRAQALMRSVTHVTYHVGQMAMVARWVHQGDWKWLTVAPGSSSEFNQGTWGSSSSRGVFADDVNAG